MTKHKNGFTLVRNRWGYPRFKIKLAKFNAFYRLEIADNVYKYSTLTACLDQIRRVMEEHENPKL